MNQTVQSRSACGTPGPVILALLGGALVLLLACGESPTGGDPPTQAGWEQPEVLAEEAVFDSLFGVSLSGDAAGDAVAVWAPSNLPHPPVLARRFSARDGWMSVETIDRGGDSSVNTPTVRMNTRGDLMAVWNTYYGLRASARAAGGPWESPQLVVRSSPSTQWGHSWGLDDAGNAIVAWTVGSSILTSRFEPGRGWRNLGALPGADQSNFLGVPALAVSASGHALAAWSSDTGEARANSFDPQGGWSPPSRIRPGGPSGAWGATAFVDASGDGIVTWAETDPSVAGGNVLYASLFDQVMGFSWAETLGPTAGTVIAASVSPDGHALVVYMSGLGLRRQRCAAGEGWQAPEPLEGVGGFDAVALDDAGDGWVLWNERDVGDPNVVTLLSRRLTDGRATGSAERVAPPFTGFAGFCGTVMDARGGLTAAWFQSVPQPDGAADHYSLVAGHYRAAGQP